MIRECKVITLIILYQSYLSRYSQIIFPRILWKKENILRKLFSILKVFFSQDEQSSRKSYFSEWYYTQLFFNWKSFFLTVTHNLTALLTKCLPFYSVANLSLFQDIILCKLFPLFRRLFYSSWNFSRWESVKFLLGRQVDSLIYWNRVLQKFLYHCPLPIKCEHIFFEFSIIMFTSKCFNRFSL